MIVSMRITQYFAIVVLIISAVLLSGCCSSLTDLNSGGGQGEVLTIPLSNGTGVAIFDANISRGGEADFHVFSDHPVNLIIMDNNNFTKYYNAEQGAPAQWSAYAIAINVTNGSLHFMAPYDNHYVFVVDNNQLIKGSGTGLTTANFSADFSYKWDTFPFTANFSAD
jgi:hypothetical protein